MVLARILLKIRGSAFFSFFMILQNISLSSSLMIIFFSFFGGRIIGIVCFNQKDSKILIALSRVQHMRLSLMGLFSLNSYSLIGAFLVIVSHGFLSPCLFFLRRLTYDKISSRSFFFFDSKNPKSFGILLIWFVSVFMRMGFPPFLLFEGEIILIKLSLKSLWLGFCFFLYFFMSGIYSLSLLSSFLSKKERNSEHYLSNISRGQTNSYLTLTIIVIPFLFLYFNPNSVIFF